MPVPATNRDSMRARLFFARYPFLIARAGICAFALSLIVLGSASVVSAFQSSSLSFKETRSGINSSGGRESSAGYLDTASNGEVGQSTATSAGFSARSGLAPIYFYPGTITGLAAATGAAPATIDLQWTAPGNDAYDAGTSAKSYIIRYSTTPGLSPALSDALFNAAADVTPAPPAPATQGAAQNLTVTGLLAGTSYYFAFKAREADGIPGMLSAGATVYAAIVAPDVSTPTFTDVFASSFTLNWTSGAVVTGYNPSGTNYLAQVSTASDFTGVISASSITLNLFATLTGLDPNTTYYARAAAAGPASTTTFRYLGSTSTLANIPFSAVSTFSAVAVTSFTVSWDKNLNPLTLTNYTVQVSTASDFNAGATDQVTASTAPNSGPGYTFTSLTAATTYYFRVRAVNHNGIYTEYAELGSTRTLGISVDIVEVIYAFGSFALNTSSVAVSSITVTNNGDVTETFYLRAATNTAGSPWTVSADSANGFNELVLQGVFAAGQPAHGLFGGEDVINGTSQASQTVAGGGRYTIDDGKTGVNVPPGESRSLWLRFTLPLGTSTTDQQLVKVTIAAQQ